MGLIELTDANLGYANTPVLSGVCCKIDAGEFVGIVGPNGSGKTTFLRTVLDETPALGGTVRIDRTPRFAYVPQIDARNLYWPLTVREAVALSLSSGRIFGRLRPEEEQAIEQALERTGITGIAERLLRDVSGGQRQRAALAQALCQKPQVLVLDEPTQGLDIVAEKSIMDIIASLHQSDGITILFVTHTLPLAMAYTSKILIFNAGKVAQASPDELSRPGRLEEIYGVEFAYGEAGGMRWAAPARESS